MEIIFSPQAIEHLQYWKKSGNKNVMDKISRLLEDINNSTFEGNRQTRSFKA